MPVIDFTFLRIISENSLSVSLKLIPNLITTYIVRFTEFKAFIYSADMKSDDFHLICPAATGFPLGVENISLELKSSADTEIMSAYEASFNVILPFSV